MFNQVHQFIQTSSFINALKITIAAVIPVVLFSYLDLFSVGFAIALGAFFTYPSDIPSSLEHKIKGISVSAILIAAVYLLVNLIYPFPLLFYPIFTLLLFILSLISVYGQRANMVSFSALLSLSLSFAHLHQGIEILVHSALLLLGGLFYLSISLVFHWISPNKEIEIQIAECMRFTAKYLKLRGDLWTIGADRTSIIEKQLHLQVELNSLHETLRSILIYNHTHSAATQQNRNMIIVFILLVEIQELALSTSFDHQKLHKKFDDYPSVLYTYQNLAYNLSKTIKRMAQKIQKGQKYISKDNLNRDLEAFQLAIYEYEKLKSNLASEGVYMLKTMLEYAAKQVEKIKTIERIFMSKKIVFDFESREKDLDKFLSPQYYPISLLVSHLSFSSTIFRHSLRLTVTVLAGFLIGQMPYFHNVYWILLTIIVILRPGFGLTKERSYHRITGTIVGAFLAFGLLLLFHNQIVIISLTVLAMLLGFAFNAKNYIISATFVTIYIVFLYSLLSSPIETVIFNRIFDTLTGALLAFLANYLLWPSWEFLNASEYVRNAIQANANYLNEIGLFYTKKGAVSTNYRLARKNAFIEVGNLMASFQRMSQEPKSKQKNLSELYQLTVLNHTVLSSVASLGTYIQSHRTTEASEAFATVVNAVLKNFEKANAILDGQQLMNDSQLDEIHSQVALRISELKSKRAQELQTQTEIQNTAFQQKMQEGQIVIEQLIWLTNLSENILKNTIRLANLKSNYFIT